MDMEVLVLEVVEVLGVRGEHRRIVGSGGVGGGASETRGPGVRMLGRPGHRGLLYFGRGRRRGGGGGRERGREMELEQVHRGGCLPRPLQRSCEAKYK